MKRHKQKQNRWLPLGQMFIIEEFKLKGRCLNQRKRKTVNLSMNGLFYGPGHLGAYYFNRATKIKWGLLRAIFPRGLKHLPHKCRKNHQATLWMIKNRLHIFPEYKELITCHKFSKSS